MAKTERFLAEQIALETKEADHHADVIIHNYLGTNLTGLVSGVGPDETNPKRISPVLQRAGTELGQLTSLHARALTRKLFNGLAEVTNPQVLQGANLLLESASQRVEDPEFLQEMYMEAVWKQHAKPTAVNSLALAKSGSIIAPYLPQEQTTLFNLQDAFHPILAETPKKKEKEKIQARLALIEKTLKEGIMQRFTNNFAPTTPDIKRRSAVLHQFLEDPKTDFQTFADQIKVHKDLVEADIETLEKYRYLDLKERLQDSANHPEHITHKEGRKVKILNYKIRELALANPKITAAELAQILTASSRSRRIFIAGSVSTELDRIRNMQKTDHTNWIDY